MTFKKWTFISIAGLPEKYYSQIKDLGISNDSIYTKVIWALGNTQNLCRLGKVQKNFFTKSKI